ncbi:hypothetical protein ES703_105482 [subsurface metagenome]
MPTVSITDTEINPTYTAGYGGGRRTGNDTELNPTYIYRYGGGRRSVQEIELNPILEEPKIPPVSLGKFKGFDFRGRGFRV